MVALVDKHLPRILFLDHVGEIGGAELCLLDMARSMRERCKVLLLAQGPFYTALKQAGANVTVITAATTISQVRRSSGLRQAILTIPYVLLLARRIAKQAREYDLIWANSQKAFVIGCFASFFARRPLVWHLHDILTSDHFSSTNRKISVALANLFASRVVTVSQAGLDSFIQSNGRPELARVVYNGITLKNAVTTPTDIRAEFKIGNSPLIGSFGRITPWKGQDVLIRALPSLPGVHAVLVGEAMFNEHEYAQSLRKLAAKLGVTYRVHFAGFRNDIPQIMGQVNIVAHTSTSPEPFGRVIVEAMLAQKPVIASDAGGAQEILTHRREGILVPPGNPDLLALAIQELLESPALARTLVENAYHTATTHFTLQSFLDGINAVATEVLAPPLAVFIEDAQRGTAFGSGQPNYSTEMINS